MQFTSFSPGVKKTCSLAETMSQAECHMARVWLSEECQTSVGSCRGGSCLPLTQWTKVPSRCSGIQSSIWIKPIGKWTRKWLISWVISMIVTFRSKWLLSISGSCSGRKKTIQTSCEQDDFFMQFSFHPVCIQVYRNHMKSQLAEYHWNRQMFDQFGCTRTYKMCVHNIDILCYIE